MTLVAAHIAKAEATLARIEAQTAGEAALVALVHLAAAFVRWETGHVDADATQTHRNRPPAPEQGQAGTRGHHDHTTAQTGEYEGDA